MFDRNHLAGLCLLALSAPALAAHVSTVSTDCHNGNVYATLTDGSTVAFSACIGPLDGNLTANPANVAATTTSIASNFGLATSFLGTSDEAVTFGPFSANPLSAAGTLTFDQTLFGDFVLGLHGPKAGSQGGQYSLYAFDLASLGAVSLHFDMAGTSLNGQAIAQNLSHAALYGSVDDLVSHTPSSPASAVPEPGTLGLTLAAVAAAAAWRRRRG
ncbi:MAG: PEP-CTERM sorting domain-containing protein [Burkholderiales bacterium]|nr:PEP-CTERM sorting domain-containing protein [Burkholderiales bacterium]